YGIGATDANPTAGGAKYAFDNGWFTPAEAIKGGGQWISNRYVNKVTSAASQQAASLGEVNGAMTELVRVAESLQNETERVKVSNV
ncbi:hypothetical protein ACW7EJ_13145, partial [Acinetobacter soli]